MESVLKKEWNGYRFELVKKSDFPRVLEHLRNNFYRDEPMHKILGVPPERIADMDQRLTNILNLEHGSFYAFRTDQPDKIAAVLIIWYQQKGFELPYYETRSPLTSVVKKVLSQLREQYSIHDQRGVDVYPELFIISTDREHRGKGLATEMYCRAIDYVKLEGTHKFVSSTFTNPFSLKLGQKLGFKPVSRLELNDVRNDDGSLVFGQAGDKKFIVETVLDL